MDKTQQIKADLEAYRASKQATSPVGAFSTPQATIPKTGDIKADLEAFRASKQAPEKDTTFWGDVARGIVRPFAKVGASLKAIGEVAQGQQPTGVTSKFLGNVRPIGEGFDVTQGLTPENVKATKDAVGTGLDIASNIPVAKGLNIAKNVAVQPFKKTAFQTAKAIGKEGAVQSGLNQGGIALQEDKDIGGVLGNTLLGIGTGYLGGFTLGGIGTKVAQKFTKTPPDIISQQVDNKIRKVFGNTTADVGKIDEMAFKAKKGLELLNKESPNIKIPDSKAPLGSKTTKSFEISKATPNELLSAVNEMDKKIVDNARQSVQTASKQGFAINTNPAKEAITQAVNNGDISPAVASRMYKQIENTGGDANKVFDWVQDVNVKYKKKYQRGTIEDTMVGKLADDVAETLRKQLNTVTDRSGYAEAFGNNQELKRMLVAVAKKANKNVNFGDITTDAGIDTAISILTGNPAYMARTAGSTLFRGILSKFKNTQGIRNVRGAIKGIGKIPTETKLPSTELKQTRLQLPAPKKGSPMKSINTPINQPSRKSIEQGTEIVPRTKIKDIAENNTNPLINEAKKYKSAEEFVNKQPTVYHGTDAKFDSFDISKSGSKGFETKFKDAIYVSPSKSFVKQYGKNTIEGKISPNAKIIDYDKIKYEPRYDKFFDKYTGGDYSAGGKAMNAKEEFARKYFDVVKYGENEYVVLNPKVIKTKSQLEEIWKKANNKLPAKPPKLGK